MERLLTPSKITAWLDCPHYLTLRHEVEGGARPNPTPTFSDLAELLMRKGLEHETACLEGYETDGQTVLRVPDKERGETFATWTKRVAATLDDADEDVLFQVPLVHDGIRGVADFLIRAQVAEGTTRWEPVDAKLTRTAAKAAHALQLCFYAEALAAQGGGTAERLEVYLGSGEREAIGYEEIRPYWARLRSQLAAVLAADPATTSTVPEPCDHCHFCEFAATCNDTWRSTDSLVFVAGATAADRTALQAAGVDTLAALSARTEPVEGVRAERFDRLRTQAALQVEAREHPDDKAPTRLIPPGEDPAWGHGFDQLPAPDDGDVFLDFEGHPFWRADRGLFFLFGYIASDDDNQSWQFHQLWAHDVPGEAQRVEELVTALAERRVRYPGMHVYHYNHTERSALEALTAEHQVAEGLLAGLVATGLFVDLYVVARNALQAGVESYGLKHLEQLTDYERSHEIDQGAGAVVEFDEYLRDGDQARLDSIAVYNEDDVRATRALRDWLVDQRPADLPWRSSVLDADEDYPELDELLERLSVFAPGTSEHLVGDLLGYWIREYRSYLAPRLGALTGEIERQLDDPSIFAGLTDGHLVPAFTPTGRTAKWPSMRLRFPSQEVGPDLKRSKKLIFQTVDGAPAYVGIQSLDLDEGTLDLVWNETRSEQGEVPTSVVLHDWFDPGAKKDAINLLAHQLLDPDEHGQPNAATMALLRADLPRFADGAGPEPKGFTDDLDAVTGWGASLDQSVLGIQGPPGTGKTYRGARIAHRLIQEGKRVGITAMSHHAIDNLLEGIVAAFDELGGDVEISAIRNGREPETGGLPGVTYTGNNKDLAKDGYNLVAGTAWAFASPSVLSAPVDVLLVDEAGQLALIDAAVASMSAHSVVLLGDPQQLSQVTTATHPGDSGASALGYLLAGHATMPPDRGVFLSESRRMHPDVCRFISERIYDGLLTAHPLCSNLGTGLGTGLRWLPATHSGCSTESIEEMELLRSHIAGVLGTRLTDHHGDERVVAPADVLVVAPYNDQVRLLRDAFDGDPELAGVKVGTVDKFQGREAPVVYFTMTSSCAEDMPRGADFLFSRNRLNVAVSRAQCLAYLLCTEELLSSRARTLDDMRLIATLCAFVEYAHDQSTP